MSTLFCPPRVTCDDTSNYNKRRVNFCTFETLHLADHNKRAAYVFDSGKLEALSPYLI